jgi:RTA1 like protein
MPKWILGIFITSDVIATIVQVIGAALIGAADGNGKDPTIANYILLGGLAFQVFVFLTSITLANLFLWKSRKVVWIGRIGFLISFITGTLLVYLRTCFRLSETAQGLEKALATHEIYFWLFRTGPYHGGRVAV